MTKTASHLNVRLLHFKDKIKPTKLFSYYNVLTKQNNKVIFHFSYLVLKDCIQPIFFHIFFYFFLQFVELT